MKNKCIYRVLFQKKLCCLYLIRTSTYPILRKDIKNTEVVYKKTTGEIIIGDKYFCTISFVCDLCKSKHSIKFKKILLEEDFAENSCEIKKWQLINLIFECKKCCRKAIYQYTPKFDVRHSELITAYYPKNNLDSIKLTKIIMSSKITPRCENCGCITEGGICSNCQEELFIETYQQDEEQLNKINNK